MLNRRRITLAVIALVLGSSESEAQLSDRDTREIMSVVVARTAAMWGRSTGTKAVEIHASNARGPIDGAPPVVLADTLVSTLGAKLMRFDEAVICPTQELRASQCALAEHLKVLLTFSPVTLSGERAEVSSFSYQRSTQRDGVDVGLSHYVFERTTAGWSLKRLVHTSHLPIP
jgi:hypothetical protein